MFSEFATVFGFITAGLLLAYFLLKLHYRRQYFKDKLYRIRHHRWKNTGEPPINTYVPEKRWYLFGVFPMWSEISVSGMEVWYTSPDYAQAFVENRLKQESAKDMEKWRQAPKTVRIYTDYDAKRYAGKAEE